MYNKTFHFQKNVLTSLNIGDIVQRRWASAPKFFTTERNVSRKTRRNHEQTALNGYRYRDIGM